MSKLKNNDLISLRIESDYALNKIGDEMYVLLDSHDKLMIPLIFPIILYIIFR